MLSKEARGVLAINTGLALSYSVSSVFVNMYLYRWLDTLAEITVFNLFQFALIPISFVLAAWLTRHRGYRFSIVLGLVLFAVFYALLIALGEQSARWLWLLGALNGFANGIFWFPFNIVLARAAEGSDRGQFFGLWGALGSVAGAFGPIAATIAIDISPRPEIGYMTIFAVVGLILALMAGLALGIQGGSSRARVKVAPYMRGRGDRPWSFALGANLAWGFRDGANWSVMSLLVLEAAGSDSKAGILTVAFDVFGGVANYLAGRLMKPARLSRFWFWGSIAGIISSLILVLAPSPMGAAGSGLLWRCAEAFALLPFNSVFFGILARRMDDPAEMAGRNIAAEITLNLGRALGSAAFLGLSFLTKDYAKILFPLVTLSLPLTWILYRRSRVN